ncbi:hypothetical protein GW17_00043717 [Ensete ventricosum]|nr:hypothetical protein GW17_00043717 [Ensete ventricosum]
MVELSRECGFREKGSGENCGKSTSVLSRNGRGWVVAVPLKETDHPPVIKGRSISPCHRASLVYSRVLVRGHLWVVGSFHTILPVLRRRENVIGRLRPGHDARPQYAVRAPSSGIAASQMVRSTSVAERPAAQPPPGLVYFGIPAYRSRCPSSVYERPKIAGVSDAVSLTGAGLATA